MIKYYCDACGKEMTTRHYDVKILCHISESIHGGSSEMIDGKFQPVSGRYTTQMICLPCYNEVMYPLWDNIKKIQTREKKEDKK